MPHCIVEYSIGLEPELLMAAVVSECRNSGLFSSDGGDIKARAIGYARFSLAEAEHFAHVQIRMLSGRTIAQKAMLSECVRERIFYAMNRSCSVSVEIVDMCRETYAKSLCSQQDADA
ncbi:5-carboxymethyl-2-hydroxymuconate Delta-isomerase [Aquipseudomonas alcaligenes]|uniref:5-carboxymethyl-2-hydroxymuconate Delta-isomerase n=1 Tax=Aquipseudomonas alcaligenes TaxID=43263 RepID=UPI0011B77377|nr:5-carboxymethyl-2-hydroxymuconate isomerase [Pseudomonas alcaligenes]